MTAKQLIDKYCTCPLVGDHPGETPPRVDTMPNHKAEAFIDGIAYFTAIRQEIGTLRNATPNRFFYLSAWWLGLTPIAKTLRIDNKWDYLLKTEELILPGAGRSLERQLEDLVQNGVDVRVLPWVMPFVTNQKIEEATRMGALNFHTLKSVSKLRKLLRPDRVVLNLLAHTFGGAHCKLIVCGDDNGMRAYTSGLDPVSSRLVSPGFSDTEVTNATVGSYRPNDKNEMAQLCDDLGKDILPKQLYREVRKWWTTLPAYNVFVASNLDYDTFLAVKQSGTYYFCLIEVRWTDREWKITFFAKSVQVDPSKPDPVIGYSAARIYLKKRQDSICFLVWPDGGWHDVGVKVEGRAAGAMHDFFKAMWDEQLTREVETFDIDGEQIVSHERNWGPLKVRQAIDLPPKTGQQYVQVLRTLPTMNFTLDPKNRGDFLVPDDLVYKMGIKDLRIKIGPRELAIPRIKIGPREMAIPAGIYAGIQSAYKRPPVSFATDGCFEFKVALKKAISEAEEYIFIADQSLYALEVMDWINARLLKKPSLKVILLFGADPADPPSNFLSEAMNKHLLQTLPLGPDQQPVNVVFYEWIGNAVHCKVTIIDDVWCAIGSANCMRRSLYTDIELSVSILESKTAPEDLPTTAAEEASPGVAGKSAPSFVQRFRRDLWAHYFGISLDPANRSDVYTGLLSLKHALSPWNPVQWRAPISKLKFGLRPEIVRQNLSPFPSSSAFNQKEYDRTDPDSRKPF